MRVHYDVGGFEEADAAGTPLAQFRVWFDEAVAAAVGCGGGGGGGVMVVEEGEEEGTSCPPAPIC